MYNSGVGRVGKGCGKKPLIVWVFLYTVAKQLNYILIITLKDTLYSALNLKRQDAFYNQQKLNSGQNISEYSYMDI